MDCRIQFPYEPRCQEIGGCNCLPRRQSPSVAWLALQLLQLVLELAHLPCNSMQELISTFSRCQAEQAADCMPNRYRDNASHSLACVLNSAFASHVTLN